MKITVMTGLLAKGDMEVDAGQGVGVYLDNFAC